MPHIPKVPNLPNVPNIPPVPGLDELDKRIADVGEFIRAQRETARMSVRRLADLAGVSNPYLSQIERGLRKPSADILQQIAKALQISAETLYVRAGLLSDEGTGADEVRHAIARDPALTPEQRGALLNVYESFLATNAATHAAARATSARADADDPDDDLDDPDDLDD